MDVNVKSTDGLYLRFCGGFSNFRDGSHSLGCMYRHKASQCLDYAIYSLETTPDLACGYKLNGLTALLWGT